MFIYLHSLIIVLLETFCCKIFFEAFGKKRSNIVKRKRYGLILSLIIIIYVSTLCLTNYFVIKQVIIIIASAIIFYNYINMEAKTSLILAILFQSFLLVIDYFSYSFIKILFVNNKIIQGHYLTESTLVVIFGKIILFLFVLTVKKNIGNKSTVTLANSEWLRFLFFPVFTIGTITAMISNFGNIQNKKQVNVLIIISLGLVGMNIVVFYLIADIIERELKIHENKIFEMQVKNQTRMYRSISENFDKHKRKTHEYKNQIICIESLVRKKKYKELESYVKEIGGNLSKELDAIDTNHVIVNAILNTKYQEAIDKNIVFVFRVNDLSEIKIGDKDIVVILANLLNNAIEACDNCINKKIIKLKFIKEEESVIISVKNTYNHLLQYENGEMITTKWEQKEEHGNGIKNIINTIEKYGGSYIMKHDNKEFYFSIILPA